MAIQIYSNTTKLENIFEKWNPNKFEQLYPYIDQIFYYICDTKNNIAFYCAAISILYKENQHLDINTFLPTLIKSPKNFNLNSNIKTNNNVAFEQLPFTNYFFSKVNTNFLQLKNSDDNNFYISQSVMRQIELAFILIDAFSVMKIASQLYKHVSDLSDDINLSTKF